MLPADHLEAVEGWGRSISGAGYVFRPSNMEGVRRVLGLAAETGVPVVPRGAGCSYGDAALRPESVVLDGSRMNRILDWDPESGVIHVEPGVTIRRMWQYAIGDGWWPSVVTGTMEPTVGGALAMNVHGKNNWQRGTFGEHCIEMEMLKADGVRLTIRRDGDAELYRASFADGQVERLLELKGELEPEHRLRSALADRLLG